MRRVAIMTKLDAERVEAVTIGASRPDAYEPSLHGLITHDEVPQPFYSISRISALDVRSIKCSPLAAFPFPQYVFT